MLGLAVKNFKAAILTMLNAIQEIQSYYEYMLIGLAVKNFKAAILTMLNAIQEIQSYYEYMLIMDEKKCHQKNKTC